jgi:hypothetical protein
MESHVNSNIGEIYGFSPGKIYDGFEETIKHRYMTSQFMIGNEMKTVNIYKEYERIQQIQFKDPISALETNSFGVFVFTLNRLYYYRQKRELFE